MGCNTLCNPSELFRTPPHHPHPSTLLSLESPASSAACFSRRRFCLASRFFLELGDPEGSDWVDWGCDLGKPREAFSPQNGGRRGARGKRGIGSAWKGANIGS